MCVLILCQDTVRSMHTGCCCHLQVSEETAERQVSHSAAQSACWCISAAFQVSPSSVCPDCKVMHINSVREMQPGFPNSEPAHTHTAAPSPNGSALRGAEAVVSQVQAAVVTGAECHTCRAHHPPHRPHTNQAPRKG